MQKRGTNIALGTAAIGRPQYINIRQEDAGELSLDAFRQRGFQVLDAAYKQGVRYFDTAPNYGMAEQMLLEWLEGKADADIEIATKWGYTYTADFDPDAIQHEVKEHSLEKLNEQWEVSRQLLPRLTTYQIHSATFDTGVLNNESVLRRLAELKKQHGLFIGITTTGAGQVEVIKKALAVEIEGAALFDVFQVTFNVLDQSLATVAPTLAAAHKRLVIKEAMANGRIFPNTAYPHYARMYNTLQGMAERYGVGVDAVAIRFCMDRIEPYQVLSGASRVSHLSDNLKAARFQLMQEDLEALKTLAVRPEAYWAERKQLGWS